MRRYFLFCIVVTMLAEIFCASSQQAIAAVAELTADRDNWLFGVLPDANYGGINRFGVGHHDYYGIPADEAGIVGFDLSDDVDLFSALEGGLAQINSVTLRLVGFPDSAGTGIINVYAVSDANADWVEGSAIFDMPEVGASSYNNKVYDPDSPTAWAGSPRLKTAGVDYDSTLLGASDQLLVSPDYFDAEFYIPFSASSSVLTNLLQHWAQDTNGGLLLADDPAVGPVGGAGAPALRFYSREWEEVALHPTLIIDYSVVAGIPGDYNTNGTVDAADYVVWRKGDSPDDTVAGYNLWRANFGKPPGAGSGSSQAPVPEPASMALALAASFGLGLCISRRR